jgi:hypothetical protein
MFRPPNTYARPQATQYIYADVKIPSQSDESVNWRGRELTVSGHVKTAIQFQTSANVIGQVRQKPDTGSLWVQHMTAAPVIDSVEWLPPITQYEAILKKYAADKTPSSIRELASRFQAEFEHAFCEKLNQMCEKIPEFPEHLHQAAWSQANTIASRHAEATAVDAVFRSDADPAIPCVDSSDVDQLKQEFSTLCTSLRSYYSN